MNKFLLLLSAGLCFGAWPAQGAFNSQLWADRMASKDAAVQKAALDELKALQGPDRRQAVSILGSVLHRGPVQAEHAALGLAQLGADAEPALADLIYALSYDEEAVAVAVSSAIVPIGGRAVGELRRTLDDPNFFTRRRAADILGQIGPSAAPAAGALTECLTDTQYEVQNAAEKALGRIGPAAIPELMHAFAKGNEVQRRQIVQLLGHYGKASVDALISIAKKDPSGFVRLSAMEQLGQIQPFPHEALPVLLHGLSDLDEGVRGGAADILGSLGPAAKAATGPLKQIATGDPDTLVRQKALDALAVITSTETLKK